MKKLFTPLFLLFAIHLAAHDFYDLNTIQTIEITFTESDDGAHNDGTANDGIYGAAIPLNSTLIQYYIYAENTNAGVFSSLRAEHEFHSINATTSEVSLTDIVINEFMASNDATIADQDGEFEDWIELYNGGETEIDLTGYFLSDDAENLTQWVFPEGTTITANGYLTIWADDDEDQAGLHANFKLSASAESIFLVNPDGEIIDAVVYTDQTADVSFARIPNGTGDFQASSPTFNDNNGGTTTSTISTELVNFTLKAFPNPARESFYLEIIETQLQQRPVSISNLNGTVLFQQEIRGTQEIDTSEWAAGLYIVRVGTSFLKVMIL